METDRSYIPIYKKFDAIRDELRPKLFLTDSELETINQNNFDFILKSSSRYSSSDIKRLFLLIPSIWLNIDKKGLIKIFNHIDRTSYAFEAFYGLFSFLFDIIKLDMSHLLLAEIKFKNKFINDFLEEKKNIFNKTLSTESIDLKYIEVNKETLKKIQYNLRRIDGSD